MMTARHMQLCDLCFVRLFVRRRPSWMFKRLGILLHQEWPTSPFGPYM